MVEFLSRVGAQVPLEGYPAGKAPRAVRAPVGPLTSVLSLVLSDIPLEGRRHGTVAALKRLLARMPSHVVRQDLLLGKCQRAHAAAEGPFSSVSAHVHRQVVLVPERSAAVTAPELPAPAVTATHLLLSLPKHCRGCLPLR